MTTRKTWTPQEKAALPELAQVMTVRQIAVRLGRTRHSVAAKLAEMNLKARPVGRFNDEMDELIVRLGAKEASIRLGIAYEAVKSRHGYLTYRGGRREVKHRVRDQMASADFIHRVIPAHVGAPLKVSAPRSIFDLEVAS